jgi:hypothetical protein
MGSQICCFSDGEEEEAASFEEGRRFDGREDIGEGRAKAEVGGAVESIVEDCEEAQG